MTPLKWILFVGGTATILAIVGWWYRTREEPGVGRKWAAGLRSAALILLWLILLDPAIPTRPGERVGREVALLDASLSMSRPAEVGAASLWDVSRDSVAGYPEVWLFGGTTPRRVTTDSLPLEPYFTESRLAPVVRAAASTAADIVVFTDGRLSDALEAQAEAERQGATISFKLLASNYPEIAISRLSATPWVEVGDSADVRVEIVASGLDEDSVEVEVLDDEGRARATGWTKVPEAGRFSALRLRFPVQGLTGYRRYTVGLSRELADPEVRDNVRAFYVHVGERPVGPVLLSLIPDWEPMFLLPNLDRLSGAPAVAFLRLDEGWFSIDGYQRVPPATVRRLAAAAPLLVLHGYSDGAPDWVKALARRADRLLVLPAGLQPMEIPGWGIRVGSAAAGEWYLARELPGSPLALDLSGGPVEELPPLLRARRIEAERAWAPLNLRRMRRGDPQPAVAAGSRRSRRWAVAAGEGYWRWAFRTGPGRELYRGLWTGLGGWLLAGRETRSRDLDPLRRVVERGEPLTWITPVAADSVVVELSAVGQAVSVGAVGAGDTLFMVVEPGSYEYVARAYRAGSVSDAAEGPAEVEPFNNELLPRGETALEPLHDVATANADERTSARPLASMGWPYLLLIALFCGEWAIRRFSGLR